MAALAELIQRQSAGETVDQRELDNTRFFIGRDFDAISHMERIQAMGDIGRWLIFVGSESYTLCSADRRHQIALPRTVDREGVLLAIRLAESGTPACDLNGCPTRMQDAVEIAAIGDVGDGLTIHSSRQGLAVYEDGMDDPMLTLPRGISPGMARLVVQTHVNAWRKAWEAGQSEGVRLTRADMCRVLGVRVAA